MQYQGVLTKMQTEFLNPIQYYLVFKSDFINLNQLIDKTIQLSFKGYKCLNCGENKPIYRQGYCKSCFFEVPQTADWVMRPELSTAHLEQEERDLGYEKQVQLQPHIVYLANSSHVKVGVTRKSQIPTRWIDQGAHEALEIVEAPNRYLAGITEVALKAHISDKTNWRTMLKNERDNANLIDIKSALEQYIPSEAKDYILHTNYETHLQYPASQYPKKPKSLNLEKTVSYQGKLIGIKGQYLMFEDDTVFNIRSNEGLIVSLTLQK